MSATDQQLQILTELVVECRPHGARRWDKPGTYAKLKEVRDRSLGAIIIAAVQAAEDRNAETPGVIPTPGPHWRAPGPGDVARAAVDPSALCASCGGVEHGPDDHPFITVAAARGHRRPAEAARLCAAELKTRIRPLGDRPTEEETT